MKIATIQDADGNEIPSVTQSWLAWRSWCAQKKIPMKTVHENGICKFCGGWKELTTEQFGRMWCLCVIEERTRQLRVQHSEFRSVSDIDATLDNFEIWGGKYSQDSLIKLMDYVGDWVLWPEKWLVIVGNPGSGKSHILSAMDKMFSPWSLYITSADFEAKAFKATKKTDEYDVDDMINVVSQAPILLFDDYGIEYGKEYIKALTRRVIDFRYRRPTEYVTVVTSNLNKENMQLKDDRVADRLFDTNIGKQITLLNVKSWRCKDGNDQQPDFD